MVSEALERLMSGRTVLLIAHRLSTVQGADDILVLSGGQVVEHGTHKQLMEINGVYARLVAKQLQ
jgi:ABC-type multidrug transport system fused ATPase/permease subunit